MCYTKYTTRLAINAIIEAKENNMLICVNQFGTESIAIIWKPGSRIVSLSKAIVVSVLLKIACEISSVKMITIRITMHTIIQTGMSDFQNKKEAAAAQIRINHFICYLRLDCSLF